MATEAVNAKQLCVDCREPTNDPYILWCPPCMSWLGMKAPVPTYLLGLTAQMEWI